MPFDAIRWIVQFAHVLAAVTWIGGGFYVLFVQLPGLVAAPPQARGPAMAELGPRQIRYILRAAEITIATGILNALVSGRLADAASYLGWWGWSIGLGAALAIGLYVLIQLVVKPLLYRILAVGRGVQQGNPAAAAEMPALLDRARRLGYLQVAAGTLIVLLMVTARLS